MESARFGDGKTWRMTTTEKSRMSPRLSTLAPEWLLGWTFRRRNWFWHKGDEFSLGFFEFEGHRKHPLQKVRCQRLIMFAGLKPRRETWVPEGMGCNDSS